MKKFMIIIMMLLMISGCSQAKEVTNTTTYIAGSAEYVNDVHSFKNDIPKLILLAEKDKTRVEAVKDRINDMKEDIVEFNALTPPESFKSQHEQVVKINESFDRQLDNALIVIDSGNKGIVKVKDLLGGPSTTKLITQLSDILKKAAELKL